MKYYSTAEGLHTDKTASVTSREGLAGDGRTFDLDLESWFVGNNTANVGMVLDASGSMAFSAENLEDNSNEWITVDSDVIPNSRWVDASVLNNGEQKKIDEDSFLTEEEVNKLLNPHNTDNSQLSYNDYTYYVFDPRSSTNEYVALGYWDGTNATYEKTITNDEGYNDKFPQANQLIGYYPFEQYYPYSEYGTSNPYGTNRSDWTLNVVTGKYAQKVKRMAVPSEGKEDFSLLPAKDKNGEEVLGNELQWQDGSFSFQMNGDKSKLNGFNASYKDDNSAIDAGLLLDVSPSSPYFTISFKTRKSAQKESSAPTAENEKTDDILYIGPMTVEANSTNGFFRIICKDNRSKLFNDSAGKAKDHPLINVNNVYGSNSWTYVTYVFKGKNVEMYFNGDKKESAEVDYPLKDYKIILNGLLDNYKGIDIFIDDLYVFDCALTKDEVKTLYNNFQNSSKTPTGKTNCNWLEGSKNISYFTAGDDNKAVAAVPYETAQENMAGWYYVSSQGDWYIHNMTLGTSKDYKSLLKIDKKTKEELIYYYGPDPTKCSAGTYSKDDAAYIYTPKNDMEPIKFFVNGTGRLCCFCNSGSGEEGRCFWSYVYKKDDFSRTKEEVLQHAVGMFVTRLEEMSPASRVSATRFSSSKIGEPDYDKLVVLDWTNDEQESARVFNLDRSKDGNVGTTSSYTTTKRGVDQYNFSMTGSTSTVTGLKAFQTYLNDDPELKKEGSGKKYLILFTDGKDTDLGDILDNNEGISVSDAVSGTKAYRIAQELRKDYTIFAVMMAAGSVTKGSTDYEQALQFLVTLAGETYVEGTLPANDDTPGEHYTNVYVSNDSSELAQIFTEEILGQIANDLDHYTVQDYIDPRFNLVDADGAVWKLENDGKVTVVGGTETKNYTVKGQGEADNPTIKLSSEVVKGKEAVLCYDEAQHMYYLVWKDQEIPGCSIGSSRLEVWNAKITVQAKEDFIGGNAVLTNGNAGSENYVYQNDAVDTQKTSDTSNTKRELNDDGSVSVNPSKGFPRTAVNVKVPELAMTDGAQLIYMGTDLTSEEVALNLGEELTEWIQEESEEPTKWYWQYLKRYAEYVKYGEVDVDKGTDYFAKLLADIVKEGDEDHSISFPYFYIPDPEQIDTSSNQSITQTGGQDTHEKDQLGILTFTWNKTATVDEKTGKEYPKDLDTQNDDVTRDTDTRISELTVHYEPLKATDDPAEKDRMDYIQETVHTESKESSKVYPWEPNRKPAAGEEQSDKDADGKLIMNEKGTKAILEDRGTYTTEIVQGEILLEMLLDKRDLEYLDQHYEDATICYSATLSRIYDGEVSTTKSASSEEADTSSEEAGTSPEEAGTFTINETVANLLNEENTVVIDGVTYVRVYGSLKKSDSFNYGKGTDETGKGSGLPLGTYALVTKSEEAPDAFQFEKTVEILNIGELTYKDKLPGLYSTYTPSQTNYTEPFSAYYAGLDEGHIYLGVEGKNINTDKRYGLARISGDLKTGSLAITKGITLNGDPVEEEYDYDSYDQFNIKLTFTPPADVELSNSYKYTLTPTSEGLSGGVLTLEAEEGSAAYTGVLTLKKNQTATIEELPLGTRVRVEEDKKLGDRYTPKYTVTDDLADSSANPTDPVTVEIGAEKSAAGASSTVLMERSVTVTNEHKTASLTIKKEVMNDTQIVGASEKQFTFTVSLAYQSKPVSGEFGYTKQPADAESQSGSGETATDEEPKVKFENGSAEVTLKNGQSITISGLPVGTVATVKEKDTDSVYTYEVGYTLTGSSEGTKQAEAEVELDGDEAEEKVTVINTPNIGTLTLSKKVQNFDSEEEFSFTVMLTKVEDGEEKGVSGSFYYYKHTSSNETESNETEGSSGQPVADGQLRFTNGISDEDIRLKAGESLTIVGLPVGTQYTVTETTDQNRYKTEVEVSPDGKISPTEAWASGSIEKDVTAKVDFTNTYNLGSLTVKKIVEGKDDEDREFSFIVTLTPPTGVKLGDTVPYEQKKTDQETSGSGATSNTGDLKLLPGESEGTYTAEFILKAGEEITLNNLPVGTECVVQETAVPGYTVTYSSTEPVTVAATGSDQASVTVTNTYNPTAVSAAPAVTKQVTGAALPKEQEFTFTLNWKEEGDDVTLPELRSAVKVPDPSGGKNKDFEGSTFTVTVPAEEKTEVQWNCREDEKLIFTRPGIYKFTVSETEDSVSGFTYDKTTWTWTVTVTDDLNGGLTAKSSYEKDTTDEDGQGPEQIIFVNTYAVTPASYQPAVQKIVNGGEDLAQKGTFTFNLKLHSANPEGGVSLKDGSPLPEMMNVQVTGLGEAEFDTLKFTKAGTYKFTIEEDGTNPLPGYTYDTARWELTVVVEDEDSELVVKSHEYYKLSSTETSNGETSNGETSDEVAAFTNMYGSADLTVTKQATGEGADPAQEFSFRLQVYTVDGAGNKTPLTGTYEAERTQISETVELTQTGYIFTLKSGESLKVKGLPRGYRYTVTENQTPEEEQHYEASYQIGEGTYILGTDTGEQVLDHDVQVVFQNENPVPKALAAKVNKKIDGVNAPQQEFTFTLEQKTGETVYVVPQETGETPGNGQTQEQIYQEAQFPMTAAVEGAGEAVFGELYFKKAGVYTFEIKETKPQEVSGGQAQESDPFEYDESVWLWTVTVTKGDDHILTLTETYMKQSGGQEAVLAAEGTWAEFVNRYEAPVGSLTISKTVEEAPASGTSPAHEPNLQQTMKEVVGGVSGGNMQGGSVSGGNVPGSSVSSGNTQGGTIPGGSVSGGNVSGGNPQGSPYTIGVTVSGGSVSGGGEAQENGGSRLEGGNTLISQSMPKNILGETKIEEFEFEVVLSVLGVRSEDISGIYGDMEFVRGVATVKLAAGESKTATGLPAGITYTVRETSGGDYDVYHMEAQERKTGNTVEGSIPQGDTALAEFINVKKETPTEPTEPTEKPTEPTTNPTEPTEKPTNPTEEPAQPTEGPVNPTAEPTVNPSTEPTTGPAEEPTAEPTTVPTAEPTASPTPAPTATPTPAPTAAPTPAPTPAPAPQKTPGPTPEATATPEPVVTPMPAPSPSPEPLRDPNLTYDENGDVVDANRQKKLPKTEDPMPLAGAALLAALSAGIMAVLSGRSLAASQGRRRKKK